MAIKESSKRVIEYLRANKDNNVTANDVADALGISARSVTGTITALGKKGWVKRVPAEIENPDGTHKGVKLLKITEEGMTVDMDAVE